MSEGMAHCRVCGFVLYNHKHFCSDKNYETLNNLNDRVRNLEKFMHENSLNIDYINSILERVTKLEDKEMQSETGKSEAETELSSDLRAFHKISQKLKKAGLL